ncbi:hypothetical protein D3C79_712050 [compost metagenome]
MFSTGLPLPSSLRLTRLGASKSRAASSETEPPFSALRFMLASISSTSRASAPVLLEVDGKSGSAVLPAGRSTLTMYTSEVLRCTPGSMRTRTRTSLSPLLAVLARRWPSEAESSSKRCQLVLNSPVCGRSSAMRKPLSSKNWRATGQTSAGARWASTQRLLPLRCRL